MGNMPQVQEAWCRCRKTRCDVGGEVFEEDGEDEENDVLDRK